MSCINADLMCSLVKSHDLHFRELIQKIGAMEKRLDDIVKTSTLTLSEVLTAHSQLTVVKAEQKVLLNIIESMLPLVREIHRDIVLDSKRMQE